MASQSAMISFLVCLTLLSACHSQGFLSQKPEANSISAELKGVLTEVLGQGHGVARSRLARIRATLSPMFNSLPKNNQGRLSNHVMRYVVRRYFSQEHAWVLKGFEPHAQHVNTSETSEDILQSKIPDYIRSVLEEKFSHNGFELEDVITMVAAMERLTFDEDVRTVESSFWLNDKSLMDPLSHAEMMEVLSSYLIVTMFGGSGDKKQHAFDKKHIDLRYPHWGTTFLFLIDIAGSDSYQRRPSSNPFVDEQKFSFSDLIRMAERVSEEFGPWSDHECHDMKELLASRDVHGNGRVKLADFYRKSQDGAWQFTEQSEYLRQLGALDESSSLSGPQVLIPNYIQGMSNCITSAPYYAICCLNECDQIYQHVEALIQKSAATTMEILKALESLPQSPTLNEKLRSRLDEVAQNHNGNVPLHGRLFAQWLHFAFPYECSYPHDVGTISPKTPNEWRMERGAEADSVSEDEIKQIIEMDAQFRHDQNDVFSCWTPTESLLVASTPSDESDRVWPNRLRMLAQVLMVICCVVAAMRQVSQIIQPGKTKKAVEYDV